MRVERKDIIGFADSALECMKHDMCKFYHRRLDKLSKEFYEFEPIA